MSLLRTVKELEITKHFFLNLTILIILLFFCLIYFEKSKKINLSKSSFTILFVFMVWICIQFSYNPVPYARYDLRIIPLVIGGLYVGIGPVLVASIIILRFFYGI